MNLHLSQAAAIEYIENHAACRREKAMAVIEEVRVMCTIAPLAMDKAVDAIKAHARIALHFHPDRISRNGYAVAESLLNSGCYLGQFETGISNGLLSPTSGGPRDLWENSLFGGAYASTNATAPERPKYGALDLMRHSDGPSPRFGSCYFLLKPAVSARATFTYLDSHRNPDERGTLRTFEPILAALMLECFERNYALGEKDITPARLIDHLSGMLEAPYLNFAEKPPARNLNHYIEAQIHGKIQLQEDVERLVVDPSFQNTPIGALLGQLCEKFAIQLCWHRGFQLPVSGVPLDFRGPTMPLLAQHVAINGWVDAYALGLAAEELHTHPEKWQARGTYAQCLQELKLLWHVLVQFGGPFESQRA